MANLFILALYLLYFWYFYLYAASSPPVPKPLTGSSSTASPFSFQLSSDASNRFQFQLNGQTVWEHDVPDAYGVENETIIERNACHGMPDGEKILASGRPLYDYVIETPPSLTSHAFQQQTPFLLQQGHVFYFQCEKDRIADLRMCPSGTIFSKGACRTVQPCTNRPDGTLLPDPLSVYGYLTCVDGEPYHHFCPQDSFFLYNGCYPIEDLVDYCHRLDGSFLLNPTTQVDCIQNEAHFSTCPPGFQFFELHGKCEPTDCLHQPDGTKLPLSGIEEGPFRFVPGYNECVGGRRQPPEYCPRMWDPLLSNGDDLTHLPMVFHEGQCDIPTFCVNVKAVEDDIVVPAHAFTKELTEWKHAPLYDSLTGYACVQGVRERVHLQPGERIVAFEADPSDPQKRHPKFKIERCDRTEPLLLPIHSLWNRYFDCSTQSVVECALNEQFDGTGRCVEKNPHAFRYEGLDLFVMSNLRECDHWIEPVKYRPQHTPVPTCSGETSSYVEAFNICSHPECLHYPFLMQIPDLSIVLPDKDFQCTFDAQTKSIQKEPVTETYDYWSQRKVAQARPVQEEPCKFGQRIRTGRSTWDRTVFATCDFRQPFVFCPSSKTPGIVDVEGKRYACEVPPDYHTLVYNWPDCTYFYPNEVAKVKPKDPNIPTVVRFEDGGDQLMPPEGLEPPPNESIELCGLPADNILVEFKYRMTYPLDVVYEKGRPRVSKFLNRAFLIHRDDFTARPVTIPKHSPEPFVADWSV